MKQLGESIADSLEASDEQKWRTLLCVTSNSLRDLGPPARCEWTPTNPNLLGPYQRLVRLPNRLVRAIKLGEEDPKTVLASIPWQRPQWLDEAVDKVLSLQQVSRNTLPPPTLRQVPEPVARNVPPKFATATLDQFEGGPTKAEGLDDLLQMDEWPSLYIAGKNGSGKSHLTAAMLHRIGGRWVDAVAVGRLPVFDGKALDVLASERVLAVDDITALRRTDTALEALFALVKKRDDFQLLTIANGAMTIVELAQWDSGLASRLAGWGQVRLVGPDRRLAKRREKPAGT